jgi:hypothetical protein
VAALIETTEWPVAQKGAFRLIAVELYVKAECEWSAGRNEPV